jgi:hypothetical protein
MARAKKAQEHPQVQGRTPKRRRVVKQDESSAATTVPPEPLQEARKLSELDLLKFIRTDNELHNHTLEIKNLEQEQVIEDREFEQRRATRTNRIRLLQQSSRQRQVEQKQLLAELGKKYGFDHTIASIDDQTGIIHEHPQKGN